MFMRGSRSFILVLLGSVLGVAQLAKAQPAPVTNFTPAQERGNYSLPYAMRPAVAPNLVRLDTTLAVQDNAFTMVPVVTSGYKPFSHIPDWGFYVRGALVYNAPENAENGAALSNPLLFSLFTPKVAHALRLAGFVGVALPIGAGGGNTPDPVTRATIGAGTYARLAKDNTLFATNYLSPTIGAAIAFIEKGWTLQAEATMLQSFRVRGAQTDKDASRTNFASGLHVGYLVVPLLTLAAELNYQHWVSSPQVLKMNPAARAQATVGIGARFNVPLSYGVILRPGIAYFHPIDDPMANAGYRAVVIDVPCAF